ncbi:hypothetical protein CK203_032668 [Vitis vinifera]|uniref:Uncharacterized protein n=1 Tax=Vitis vinifera TaxID=29760 RepID=A0A438HXP1_VITVI|nr:hypothetical protein CK203_032668 [Vitis vinifera]
MRALWHKVINGKYGDDVEGWRSCKVSEEDEVGLWKTIRKGWDILGYLFLLYLQLPPLRMLGWRRFRVLLLMGVVGHPVFLSDSMIGRWIKWSAFS